MVIPYHKVNILTGFKAARVVTDSAEYAYLIKRATRPLLVLGPQCLSISLSGRLLMEYAADIARVASIPICATAHTKKKLLELHMNPDSSYDLVEIINHLKDKNWPGVKKEGSHDLVIFLGIRADLAEQGLSTLKHFAPHLKTMTACRYYYPNADYSLPNLKDDAWQQFLEDLTVELKEKEA